MSLLSLILADLEDLGSSPPVYFQLHPDELFTGTCTTVEGGRADGLKTCLRNSKVEGVNRCTNYLAQLSQNTPRIVAALSATACTISWKSLDNHVSVY
ncbi:hypothetical protein BaRGS_00013182 [Batillaria attramentaria]|uniref:Uncharacterized protein n=1 Tax=Batillaria attramentaria TaxID=370345 RepID=A0ABD0L7X0_9CAEN